jgi:hypothetical protein
MKETWRENSEFDQSKIELIPIQWLWNYRGTNPSEMIDLGNKIVDLDGLWQNVLVNGLTAPLIMRVGKKNKKFRLETGNHLIQIFKKNNIENVPVVVQIRDICGPEASDTMTVATHNFDWGDDILPFDENAEYLKPSDVFKSLK